MVVATWWWPAAAAAAVGAAAAAPHHHTVTAAASAMAAAALLLSCGYLRCIAMAAAARAACVFDAVSENGVLQQPIRQTAVQTLAIASYLRQKQKGNVDAPDEVWRDSGGGGGVYIGNMATSAGRVLLAEHGEHTGCTCSEYYSCTIFLLLSGPSSHLACVFH